MDQTLVQSGFDLEVVLGERYLQYLLLLAMDAGVIPTRFGDPASDPIIAHLRVPPVIDRTYLIDPEAVAPYPTLETGLAVKLLFDSTLGDAMVTVPYRTTGAVELDREFYLYVDLTLEKQADPTGHGLTSAGLRISLRSAMGGPPFDQLKAAIDTVLDLGALASGGRIDDIAIRKHPAEGPPESGQPQAALGVYLNLMLRSSPVFDNYMAPRGDTLAAKNILPAGEDLAFATRSGIYNDLASDAWHRKAVPEGAGYSHPLQSGGRKGWLKGVTVEPIPASNTLQITLNAEVQVNNLPNPEPTLRINIGVATDADGVMTWRSSTAGAETSLIYDLLVAGALVAAAALIPFIGPGTAFLVFTGLEIGAYIAEGLITDAYVADRVEARLDATLLDVAPTRLTVFRRRWDPFYETQHQMGLRNGGTLINELGVAVWGKAVLTRTIKPVKSVVIRSSEPFGIDAPESLTYRVADIDPHRKYLKPTTAPGTARSPYTQPDMDNEPYLFRVAVSEAVARVADNRLWGDTVYRVQRIFVVGGTITKLLVISERELNEVWNAVKAEREALIALEIRSTREAQVRADVVQEAAALGLALTPAEIDERVEGKLQELIKEALDAYAQQGELVADVLAAVQPLLSFELPATYFGQLQHDHVLKINGYDLVYVASRSAYYYRDHFVPELENTAAKRLADNLMSLPRYRSTPDGPEFID